MTGILLSALHGSRRKPLAACVASIFALIAPTATLATTVTSCADDGGGGTLRSAIAAAADGETVDFAGLDCTAVSSTITLFGTPISIQGINLTIDGSGATTKLTIDASSLPRGYAYSHVFAHNNPGPLTVTDLVLKGGYVKKSTGSGYGGCVVSIGNLTLNSVTVTECSVKGVGAVMPHGGAVLVAGNLTLNNSIVSYSSVTGNASSAGGGVYVTGDLSVQGDSSISHNSATAATGTSRGGGAYVIGNVTVQNSIVSHNSAISTGAATSYGGGAFVKGNLTLDSGALLDNSAHSGSSARGGGAYVAGNLNTSNNSSIGYDSAGSTSGIAKGGGVYAKSDLTLQASSVLHNTVYGYMGAYGGGAYVRGNSAISYTSVTYNNASRWGGGLWLNGATSTIASSTISNNTASAYGGIFALFAGAGATFELKNSTISNNHADLTVGGLVVGSGTVKLFNSTIAFNTAGSTDGGKISPGAFLSTDNNAMAANLQSMLISNNSVGTYQLDLTTFPFADSVSFNGGALAIPANNLVRATQVTNLPTDTKQDVCPHLGPLRDNGGLTFTHALLSHSPAIDTGNDSFLLLPYDQRGSVAVNGMANYTRLSGNGFLTDIGAYEVQQNDIVFNTDFDDCLPLSF